MWVIGQLQYAGWRAVILTFVCIIIIQSTTAQVRTSSSYQLQSDSINVGGGFATSTSYVSESTFGEVATGRSTSSLFGLQAGFQQMQANFISLSISNNILLGPDLPGITGGTSTASTTVVVTTDGVGGYELSIAASLSPAMQGSEGVIADYAPTGLVPDFLFIVPASAAAFGFSPAGIDRAVRYRSAFGICGSGTDDIAQTCWDGFSSTTHQVIAVGSGGNQPLGTPTTIYFQVGIGSGATILPGSYIATTTLTALSL